MKVFIALVLPLLILGSAIAFATVVPHKGNTPHRPVVQHAKTQSPRATRSSRG